MKLKTISIEELEDFAKNDTVRIMHSLNKDMMLTGTTGGEIREAKVRVFWDVPMPTFRINYNHAVELIRTERNTWGVNWRCIQVTSCMDHDTRTPLLHFRGWFQKIGATENAPVARETGKTLPLKEKHQTPSIQRHLDEVHNKLQTVLFRIRRLELEIKMLELSLQQLPWPRNVLNPPSG